MKTNHPSDDYAFELFRSCTPLFQALGDPVRQDIILLLAKHDSLNVSQIAEQSPMSRPTISHHLKILREVGLVAVERKATENYYSLQIDNAVTKLKEFIQAVEQC